MSGTTPELLCKCCVAGITQLYRVTIEGITAGTCPNCLQNVTYVFDLAKNASCMDVLVNGWCYTTCAFTIEQNENSCIGFINIDYCRES